MECVSETQVLGFLRDTLDSEQRAALEHHLDTCAECLELVTLASKTSLAAPHVAHGSQDRTQDRAADRARTRPADRSDDRSPDDAGALSPGTSLGRYEILEPIGRGGMGMVYAARDAQLDRRVAIKVVNPSLAQHAHSQIGLLREAQAMARITQPNVLTVYDMGTVDGAVFLAAELVEGDTLDAWLARPRRWRQIVEVFVQAARGLDAAHAAGLVHRDFKPTNVLVGADGRVRVFDFGLVRFTDSVAPGRELAGTPLYMSPEQLRGDLADARSDQYAFCVALHQALFGEHPGSRGEPPAAPAPRATDRVPGWLRDLVQRGLEPDPARRFPSMRAVIAAIERGLGRRRRAVLVGVACLAVSAAAATALLGYVRGKDEPFARCPDVGPSEAWSPTRKVQLAAAFIATGVSYAPGAWARAERQLDQFDTRWRGQQRQACLAFTVHQTEDRELHDRRRACFDQHRLVFGAIVDRLNEVDPKLLTRVDRLLGALPDLEACTHPGTGAWPADAVARARFAGHFAEVARVTSLAEAGQYDEAARRAEPLAGQAKSLGFRRGEADAAYLAGHVAGYLGRADDAVRLVEAALWAAEATRYDEMVVTAACELLYLVGSRQRRPAEARRFVELARAAAERVGSITARARAARTIGNLELAAGHFDAAERELRAALALVETQRPSDPVVIASLLLDLANLDSQRGRFAAAEPPLRRAIAMFVQELGELHPTHARALNNLGNLLLDQRRHTEAAAVFDQAIAIQERALGPDHPDVATLLGNAEGVYIVTGDLVRARALLERSIAIYQKVDPAHPVLASAFTHLADVSYLEGNLVEAARLHTRALALRRQRLGEHHPDVTKSLLKLAGLALLGNDLRAAGALCDQAVGSVTGSDAGNQTLRAAVETCRGQVELAAGRPAVAILEHALELHRGGEDPARLAETQFALARALPPTAAARAIELARAARDGFARELAFRAPERARVDAWLRRHAR